MLFSFEVGDYLLHPKYGLGRFCAVEYIQLSGGGYEFLKLEYKSSTFIYIPVFNVDLLKFHSPKDSDVEIEEIGSSKILRKKEKLKEDVYKVAQELIQISAARKMLSVDTFQVPDDYEAFCNTFEHQLTPSQAKAQKEVLQDLASTTPTDRLICGDVGFGKTELAIRAAFVVVRGRKQVIIVAPTTLLAQQHYKLFSQRFEQFGIKCGVNSRLDKSGDCKSECDILITTASNKGIANILNENIGLVVLDEEQHFGARFKEEIKARGNFLQLSAMPIPRTLNLALAGIKDISVLDIPPLKRKNTVMQIVYDYELDNKEVVLEDIIHEELQKGGRAFLVVPRVSLIGEVEQLLSKFKQKINYVIMHGRLSAREIEDNMCAFKSGQKPVLIATNIIESGLNILEANLMIVFRPHMFGISQLYQLRGRVGRAESVGHVYLIAPIMLKEIAQERLQILVEHSFLGANMPLAMHDISTRGAGSVLGTNQSGKDYGFGVEAYYEMLSNALQKLSYDNQQGNQQTQISVANVDQNFELSLEGFTQAYIPSEFIESEHIRLDFYKKLSKVKNETELQELRAQLEYFNAENKSENNTENELEKQNKLRDALRNTLPFEIENFLQIIEIKYLTKNYCAKHAPTSVQQLIKKIAKREKCAVITLDACVLNEIGMQNFVINERWNVQLKFDPGHRKKTAEYYLEFNLQANGYNDAGNLIIDFLKLA